MRWPIIVSAVAMSIAAGGCGARTALSLAFDAAVPATEGDAWSRPPPTDGDFDAGPSDCAFLTAIVQPIHEAVVRRGVFAVDTESPPPVGSFARLCRTPSCAPGELIDRQPFDGSRARLTVDAPGVWWISMQCGDYTGGGEIAIHVRAPAELLAFDRNLDGRDDVAVGAPDASTVSVFVTQGTELLPGFSIHDDAPGFGSAIAAPGDLDADGIGDLVAADANGVVGVFHQLAPPAHRVFMGRGPVGLHAAGDVDLDGYPDVLITRSGSCEIELMLGGRAEPRVVSLPGASGGCDGGGLLARPVGDLDGDGRPEIARVHADGSISFWGGADPVPHAVWPGLGDGRQILDLISADLHGDHRRSLVLALRGELVIVRAPLESPTTLTMVADLATGARPLLTDLGDVDGDGRGDVGVATASGYSIIFGGESDPTPAIPLALGDLGAPPAGTELIVGIHDVDGDGRPDIACRARDLAVALLIGEDRLVREYWPLMPFSLTPEFGTVIAHGSP